MILNNFISFLIYVVARLSGCHFFLIQTWCYYKRFNFDLLFVINLKCLNGVHHILLNLFVSGESWIMIIYISPLLLGPIIVHFGRLGLDCLLMFFLGCLICEVQPCRLLGGLHVRNACTFSQRTSNCFFIRPGNMINQGEFYIYFLT